MDVTAKFDADIQAKIRQDYSALNSCVEYMSTVVMCWGKKHSHEQKKTLKHFLSLREKGKVPPSVTVEEMKAWIISQERNAFNERFKRENTVKDDLTCLTWEVNMKLKLQDMEREACRELGLPDSSLTPLASEGLQLSPWSDLQSSAMGEIAAPGIFAKYHFDPEFVVQRAIKEIMHELMFQRAPRPPCLSEVVVDVVTGLVQAIMCHQEGPNGSSASSRCLSTVAVGTVVSVLHSFSAPWMTAAKGAVAEMEVMYSHSVRVSLVAAMHRELLGKMGSNETLKKALKLNDRDLTSAITAAVTAKVEKLCEPLDPLELTLDDLEMEDMDVDVDVDVEEPVLSVLEIQEPVLDNVEPAQEIQECVLDNMKPAQESQEPVPDNVEPAVDVLETEQHFVNALESLLHVPDTVMEGLKPVLDIVKPALDVLEGEQLFVHVPESLLHGPETFMEVLEPVLNIAERVSIIEEPFPDVQKPETDEGDLVHSPQSTSELVESVSIDLQSPLKVSQSVQDTLERSLHVQESLTPLVAVPENLLDIPQSVFKCMDSVKVDLESALNVPEHVLNNLQVTEVQEPARHPPAFSKRRGMQEGRIMDEPCKFLSNGKKGSKEKAEDISKHEKKPKKGIRRLFSRIWKAVKRSGLCCCCCVTAETD